MSNFFCWSELPSSIFIHFGLFVSASYWPLEGNFWLTDKLTAKSFELSSSEIALVYTRKKVTLLVLGKPKWPKKKNKILRYLLLTYSTLDNMYMCKEIYCCHGWGLEVYCTYCEKCYWIGYSLQKKVIYWYNMIPFRHFEINENNTLILSKEHTNKVFEPIKVLFWMIYFRNKFTNSRGLFNKPSEHLIYTCIIMLKDN